MATPSPVVVRLDGPSSGEVSPHEANRSSYDSLEIPLNTDGTTQYQDAEIEDQDNGVRPPQRLESSVPTSLITESISQQGDQHVSQNQELGKLGRLKLSAKPSWSLFLRRWIYQLLATLLALLACAGLITIAAIFANRPLSEWPSQQVSVSGVVAILTTILKAALVVPVADTVSRGKWSWFLPARAGRVGRPLGDLEYMDDASRGPWGSLVWLSRHPFHLDPLTIGAVLTILVVPLSFLTQQLISIDNRRIVDPLGNAHVPWTLNNGRLDEPGFLAAEFQGIYSTSIEDLPVTCSSGNCDWNTIPSLGVCGDCTDVSNRIPDSSIECNDFTCNYTIQYRLQGDDMSEDLRAPRPGSKWARLPEDENYSNADSASGLTISRGFSGHYTADPYDAILNQNSSILKLAQFLVFHVPYWNGHQNLEFGDLSLTQCLFWHCMQAFTVRVVSGQSVQPLTRSDRIPSVTAFPDGQRVKYNDVPGFNMEGHNFTFKYGWSSDTIYEQRANVMNITRGSRGLSFENYEYPFWHVWNITLDDRKGWADRVAKSFSNLLRSRGRPNATEDVYAGDAFIQEAYIRVIWPWLVYPLVLLLAALSLLILGIVRTLTFDSKLDGRGALALLMSDIDPLIREKAQAVSGPTDDLTRAIGKTKVYCEGNHLGWTFRSTES